MNTRETEKELFEKSFGRPSNFWTITAEERWAIDKRLGILDWKGAYMDKEDRKRFHEHYDKPK